jgi:hypothetical protein
MEQKVDLLSDVSIYFFRIVVITDTEWGRGGKGSDIRFSEEVRIG